MDDAVKEQLDGLEKRLQSADKRFDDVKWYFTGAGAFLGIVFTVLTILTGKQSDTIANQSAILNAAIDKQNDRLASSEKEIKDDEYKALQHIDDDIDRRLGATQENVRDFRSDVESRLDEKSKQLTKSEDDLRQEVHLREAPAELTLMSSSNQLLDGHVLTADLRAAGTDRTAVPHIHFEHQLRNAGKAPSGPMVLKVYSNDIPFADKVCDEDFKYCTTVNGNIGANSLPGGGYTETRAWNVETAAFPSPGRYPMLIKIYYGEGQVTKAMVMADVH